MDEELPGKVLRWLENTGFPLEMRVADKVRHFQPLWVDQSRNFLDPVSGKVRETDVVAGWSDDPRGKVYVFLVMECKAKPAPWVVFDEGGQVSDDADVRLWWAARRAAEDGLGNLSEVSIPRGTSAAGTLLGPSRVGHGVVEVTFKDHQAHERNPAWDAVRSAVAAAHGVLGEFDSGQIQRKSSYLYAVPVVVTSGRLFRAFQERGATTVEEVERGEVVVRPGSRLEQTRCLIVTESAMPQLLTEAEATPALVSKHA